MMDASWTIGHAKISYTHHTSPLTLNAKSGSKTSLSDLVKKATPACRLNPLLFNGHLQTMWTAKPDPGPPIYYKRQIFESDHAVCECPHLNSYALTIVHLLLRLQHPPPTTTQLTPSRPRSIRRRLRNPPTDHTSFSRSHPPGTYNLLLRKRMDHTTQHRQNPHANLPPRPIRRLARSLPAARPRTAHRLRVVRLRDKRTRLRVIKTDDTLPIQRTRNMGYTTTNPLPIFHVPQPPALRHRLLARRKHTDELRSGRR
jgi:hypothetical protein